MNNKNSIYLIKEQQMRLVYKFKIKQNDKIYDLCRISKNLYNQALYLVKKELKENNLIIDDQPQNEHQYRKNQKIIKVNFKQKNY